MYAEKTKFGLNLIDMDHREAMLVRDALEYVTCRHEHLETEDRVIIERIHHTIKHELEFDERGLAF